MGTAELGEILEERTWNGDWAKFADSADPTMKRGGEYGDTTRAGIFAFFNNTSVGAAQNRSFRPVWVMQK